MNVKSKERMGIKEKTDFNKYSKALLSVEMTPASRTYILGENLIKKVIWF